MLIAPVTHLIGWFLAVFGLAMFFPAIVDWAAANPDWFVFVTSGAATTFFGMSLILVTRGTSLQLTLRQGFLLTTGSWVTLAIFGAVPFAFSDQLPLDYTDAFFETMSGLTTTGSTVITGLDHAPPGFFSGVPFCNGSAESASSSRRLPCSLSSRSAACSSSAWNRRIARNGLSPR